MSFVTPSLVVNTANASLRRKSAANTAPAVFSGPATIMRRTSHPLLAPSSARGPGEPAAYGAMPKKVVPVGYPAVARPHSNPTSPPAAAAPGYAAPAIAVPELSADVLSHIFSFIDDIDDVVAAMLVCHDWHDVIEEDSRLWKKLFGIFNPLLCMRIAHARVTAGCGIDYGTYAAGAGFSASASSSNLAAALRDALLAEEADSSSPSSSFSSSDDDDDDDDDDDTHGRPSMSASSSSALAQLVAATKSVTEYSDSTTTSLVSTASLSPLVCLPWREIFRRQVEAPRRVCVSGTSFILPAFYEIEESRLTYLNNSTVVTVPAFNTRTEEDVVVAKHVDPFRFKATAVRCLREIEILTQLDHDNVLEIVDIVPPASIDFSDLFLVFEETMTDLGSLLASGQELSDDHAACFAYQLLRGLKYLHGAGLVHRDLSPQNLLLTEDCDLKIGGFVVAKETNMASSAETEYVTSRAYRPPESILGSTYVEASDVFSAACIIAEIFNRAPLFPGKDVYHQLRLIVAALGTPSEAFLAEINVKGTALRYMRQHAGDAVPSWAELIPDAPSAALDLVGRMLRFDFRDRLSVEDALAHSFLAGYHDPDDEPVPDEPFVSRLCGQDAAAIDRRTIKELILDEIAEFHPEDVAFLKAQSAGRMAGDDTDRYFTSIPLSAKRDPCRCGRGIASSANSSSSSLLPSPLGATAAAATGFEDQT